MKHRCWRITIGAAVLVTTIGITSCGEHVESVTGLPVNTPSDSSTIVKHGPQPESSTQFYPGYCTHYAADRFDQTSPWPHCNWGGNANAWLANANTAGWRTYGAICFADPTRSLPGGSVVQWNGGSYGHVAYIEYVTTTGIGIAEMNWVGWNEIDRKFLTWAQVANRGSYTLAGYILPIRK